MALAKVLLPQDEKPSTAIMIFFSVSDIGEYVKKVDSIV